MKHESPCELLSAPQVAERFNVNRVTVLRWIREGLLPAIRTPGGQYRIKSSDCDKALQPYKAKGVAQ